MMGALVASWVMTSSAEAPAEANSHLSVASSVRTAPRVFSSVRILRVPGALSVSPFLPFPPFLSKPRGAFFVSLAKGRCFAF